MMMVIKTVIILWLAISSATWIEATSEEDTLLRKWLKSDSLSSELFLKHNPALYDEHGGIDCFDFRIVFSSTPRPEQVPSLVTPPVHQEPVTDPTPPLVPNPVPNSPKTATDNLSSKGSTSPPPSSTTENDLSKQLLTPFSYVTGNRPSEETLFSEVSTTEGSILEGKSSSAIHTDKDFVSEELESPLALSAGEEITSKKIEPPEGVLPIEIIIAGLISAGVLLIILFIVIQNHVCVRKTADTEYKKCNQHSHMVYQPTVEVI